MAEETTNTAVQQTQQAQTAEDGTEAQQTANTAVNQTAGEQEKTFTQAEVNSLIQSRLERERKGQPTKDELAAFRKWQDEQKTAEQRHTDEIKKAQDAQNAAEQKTADLEAKLTAFFKGVKGLSGFLFLLCVGGIVLFGLKSDNYAGQSLELQLN